MTDVDWEPALVQLKPREARIFHLNMIKVGHLLDRMQLTVEERQALTELVKAYFGDKVPPYPWTEEQTRRRVR